MKEVDKNAGRFGQRYGRCLLKYQNEALNLDPALDPYVLGLYWTIVGAAAIGTPYVASQLISDEEEEESCSYLYCFLVSYGGRSARSFEAVLGSQGGLPCF